MASPITGNYSVCSAALSCLHLRKHQRSTLLILRIGSKTWWRHQMETFSTLLAICAGNSPVPGEFPSQRPVTQSFDVFFDLRLNKRLSKQWWGWWFETLSHPLWCHRNECHRICFGMKKSTKGVPQICEYNHDQLRQNSLKRLSACHNVYMLEAWWRHHMEAFPVLLAFCEGNSLVPGEFPTHKGQ